MKKDALFLAGLDWWNNRKLKVSRFCLIFFSPAFQKQLKLWTMHEGTQDYPQECKNIFLK